MTIGDYGKEPVLMYSGCIGARSNATRLIMFCFQGNGMIVMALNRA